MRGEGKVLVVTDARGDARDWEPLVAALKASERIVQVRMAYEFPRDALSLLPYDLVIFPNVPADAFDAVQLQALRDAVYHQGTGFLMLGGPQSFGPGGYHRSAIEEALPVTMDVTQKKVLPKGALAIILHTCEFAEGNTWAKRIAKEAMRVLGAQDEVGLLDFEWAGGRHNGMHWVFPLTPAGQYEKLAVADQQGRAGRHAGFSTGMQMAFTALKASDASVKHTDRHLRWRSVAADARRLVQGYVDAKISVSMVAINPHGGSGCQHHAGDRADDGRPLLFPAGSGAAPEHLHQGSEDAEALDAAERVFTPMVEFPSPVLKGIDAMPQLRGYVLTTPKPRASDDPARAADARARKATCPIRCSRPGASASAPLRRGPATSRRNWARGLGRVGKVRAFVKQLAQEISRVEQKSDLHLRAFASGGTGVITVEDFAKEETFLDLTARITGPRGETRDRAAQTGRAAPLSGEFPLWGKGRYQVMAAGTGSAAGKERNEQALGGFAVPYSPRISALPQRSDSAEANRRAHRRPLAHGE